MKNKRIYLRVAKKGDLKDLYLWRNEAKTRKNAFNTKKIALEDHIKWFKASLANTKRDIFIIINSDRKKIGQIRFDRKGKSAEIDISVAGNERSKGYGREAIKRGCRRYFESFGLDYIIAKIKKTNLSSIKAFKKAGFKKHKDYKDYIEFRLIKR